MKSIGMPAAWATGQFGSPQVGRLCSHPSAPRCDLAIVPAHEHMAEQPLTREPRLQPTYWGQH